VLLIVGAGYAAITAVWARAGPWYIGAIVLVILYTALIEPHWLEVTRQVIRVRPIAREAGESRNVESMRIALVSDIHFCGLTSGGWLRAVMRRASAFDPHIIVIAGDFLTNRQEFWEPCMEALRLLEAKLGIFAVPGNHDHWTGIEPILEGLRSLGVTVLINDAAVVEGGPFPVTLLGVDDCFVQRDDLSLALKRADQLKGNHRDAVKILVSHNPDIILEAAERSIDIVLAGHTHGLQIRIPPLGLIVAASDLCKRFSAGRFTVGDTQLYVGRGLGQALFPFRSGCRPELALITVEMDSPVAGRKLPGTPASGERTPA
jgi:predicted MPP superfamily phosphohydrolase